MNHEFNYLFLIDPIQVFSKGLYPQDYELLEEGYTSRLLAAYQRAFDKPIDGKMSHELILSIHSQLKFLTRASDGSLLQPGVYKTERNSFSLSSGDRHPKEKGHFVPPCASMAGIREFMQTWMIDAPVKLHMLSVELLSDNKITNLENSVLYFSKNKNLLAMRKVHGKPITTPYQPEKDDLHLTNALEHNPWLYNQLPNKNELTCYTVSIVSMPNLLISPKQKEFSRVLRQELDRIFDHYNASIREVRTENEKLECIAACVQRIVQLHPFADGNIRTCYVLLNRLLFEENLSLTLLIDPNRLTCFSVKELVSFIQEGQKYARSLLREEIPAFEQDRYLEPYLEAHPEARVVLQPVVVEGVDFFTNLLKSQAHRFFQQKKGIHDRGSMELALRKAAANNLVADVKYLLRHFKGQFDINAKDSRPGSEKTALRLAAERGHCHVVETLVKAGADASLLCGDGVSAQHFIEAMSAKEDLAVVKELRI